MRNPRDGRFKSLAEGPPELLLRLIGLWEPGMEAQAIDLLRELQIDAVQIDHATGLATRSCILRPSRVGTGAASGRWPSTDSC